MKEKACSENQILSAVRKLESGLSADVVVGVAYNNEKQQ